MPPTRLPVCGGELSESPKTTSTFFIQGDVLIAVDILSLNNTVPPF